MVRSNSLVERWTPRLICLSVSTRTSASTWFSQEALVGVKWACQRGRLANQSRKRLGLVGPAGVVHDDVDVEISEGRSPRRGRGICALGPDGAGNICR